MRSRRRNAEPEAEILSGAVNPWLSLLCLSTCHDICVRSSIRSYVSGPLTYVNLFPAFTGHCMYPPSPGPDPVAALIQRDSLASGVPGLVGYDGVPVDLHARHMQPI